MQQPISQILEQAVTHHREGRIAEAEALYRAVLEADPGNAAANHLLGVISYQAGNLPAAIDLISKALQQQPDYAEAHNNLGLAFYDSRRFDEAEASYGRALKLRPDYVEALGNLGTLLKRTGRIEAGEKTYRRALELQPDNARGHNNLGTLLTSARRFEEAEQSYRRALELDPAYDEAHSNLLLTMTYMPERTPADLLDEARRYGTRVTAGLTPHQNYDNSRDPERRLRVGFVSADLNRHPVGYFLESVFENLARGNPNGEKLELFIYATSGKEDDLTEKFRSCVSRWRNVTLVPNVKLADEIAAEGIDILVDLAGHTAHNRLPLFARKPAPVQITWLGFGGTTGLDAMDYMLCDRWVIPPEDESHFAEKPWRLPDSFVCFTPPDSEMVVEPPPVLKNGHITFGCFNNVSKIGDEAFSCWAEILKSVPGSKLFLKARALADAPVQQRIGNLFSSHGVEAERLMLEGFTDSPAKHLEAYNRVDVALDPFPYSGGTITVEALWMGVPVLTLKGDRYTAHIGESLLHTMGLDEWIADSRQDYVAKAAAFTSDVDALTALRDDLRGRLLASPLCDAPRFARDLEDAFRGMWRAWCESQI